ncbi:RUS1 family protein [Aspergillus mulundensis]|uniref:Protein root UVB sensitive/RUS domain-containing protein n=1 Tax=Aspergillus mulundensis TaxID=1810919 RepID=A0A3D8QF26_9EURO|nr:hypothetical protein DSM5745_10785 [Aspergillus mulundensis]RDW60327.1 hypothetical protein DSM5745_10785 [Aspergillus mulundensis]
MAPASERTITFTEVNKLNKPTLTYIYSLPSSDVTPLTIGSEKGTTGRLDIAHTSSPSTSWSLSSLRSFLVNVFLPAGYPTSVSDDYTPYQIFDSLQAFSSSIAGLLASRAVLQGVGVGNADASPTSALLLHILQDTSGRIATILFAHRVGTALEPECKMYRFAADIFNDLAMVLDCLSPMIPAGLCRVTVLSAAGVLRALCGVAGGSSKASLGAHFALWGNLAEVNAKDSSQETVISLIGMLVGSLVVSHITGFTATWLTLILLLTMHLSLNYAAVRSVQMTTLNRQRANIIFSSLLSSDPDFADFVSNPNHQDERSLQQKHIGRQVKPLTPAQVAKQERIFDAGSALKWYPSFSSSSAEQPQVLGSCEIGVSVRQFFSQSSHTTSRGPNSLKTNLPLREITALFEGEAYILSLTPASTNISATVILKQRNPTADTDRSDSDPKTNPQLKAWMHALLAAKILSLTSASTSISTPVSGDDNPTPVQVDHVLQVVSRTLDYLNGHGRFQAYIDSLRETGWEVNGDGEGGGSALETRVVGRVVVSSLS